MTFDDNSSLKINLIVCGVPRPVVEGKFIGKTLNAQNATVNSFTTNYTLELPQLTQTTCGKELTITATGLNDKSITLKTKIFLRNCKYAF